MEKIVRITVRSKFNVCQTDAEFHELIAVSAGEIRYRYTPRCESEENPSRSWSYASESPAFRKLFRRLAGCAEKFLSCGDPDVSRDAGVIALTVVYADQTKKNRIFSVGEDRFSDCLRILNQMIPSGKAAPKLLEGMGAGTGPD